MCNLAGVMDQLAKHATIKLLTSKNSLMLIHQLSGGNAGKYAEMKDENENLDVLMDFIVNHYLENTQICWDQLRQKPRTTTYYY